jgi:uncharacterized YigZ family protein
MTDTFKTISLKTDAIFKVKGSKFLAFAIPVNDEEQIKSEIQEFRKKYHDARHVCFAWITGPERLNFRVNDDGEPSGTAGKPILGQINSRELTDVLVVVVRYFGGILLGTGGLIQAYREAASEALNQAEIIICHVEKSITIRFDYQLQNHVIKVLRDHHANIKDRIMEMNCTFTLSVPATNYDALMEELKKIHGVGIIS